MELKSSQIALAGVVIRLIDQIIITPSHFLVASSKDKWIAWSNNLSSSILTTLIIAALFAMLCIDKTKTPAAILSILFGAWFITSGLVGVGFSAILFLLAYPIQFAFTFTPASLLIISGKQYLLNENQKTARQIEELKNKIF